MITLPFIAGPHTVLFASAAAIGPVPPTHVGSPRMIALKVAKSAVVLAPHAAPLSTTTVRPLAAANTASRLPAPPDTVESRMSTELASGADWAFAGVATPITPSNKAADNSGDRHLIRSSSLPEPDRPAV